MPTDQEQGVLYVPYADTIDLLSAREALAIAEDVYRMQGEDTVMTSSPPSFKLDIAKPFHNHWHVKCALLKETPVTGVRLYNYFNDGERNTVGQLECARWVVLTDPHTGHARAIVEEHWTYAIRSAAATILGLKYLGPKNPKIVGIVGVGTMATNALRCLVELYDGIEEIRCTSRRPETREAFAAKWSEKLGISVVPKDSIEEAVRDADIGIDIELTRAMKDRDDLVARYFSDSEKKAYFVLPPARREQAFFRLWTRKEAFVKGIGLGFSRPLESFTVNADVPARIDAAEAAPWNLHHLNPGDGFVGAVAICAASFKLRGGRLECA